MVHFCHFFAEISCGDKLMHTCEHAKELVSMSIRVFECGRSAKIVEFLYDF